MNVRLHERIPADIEIGITNLSRRTEPATGFMVDASKSGIAVLLRICFKVGDIVRLDVEDGQLFGHIIYVHEDNGMFRTGVAVEDVLLGRSDLGKLVEALSREATADTAKAIRPE